MNENSKFKHEFVISYSLFLYEKYASRCHEYMLGALANVQARDRHFEKFTLVYYVDENLRENNIIKYLQTCPKVQIIFKKYENFVEAVQWRYEPVLKRWSNLKVVLVRDINCVLSLQDSIHVNEWLKQNDKAFLFYREYLMAHVCCGGGVSINFNALCDFDMNYIVKRANLFQFSTDSTLYPQQKHEKDPERKLIKDKLNYLFDYVPKEYVQEIILRVDQQCRYHEYKNPNKIIFESISFVVEHVTEENLWYVGQHVVEKWLRVQKSPESFIWITVVELANLSEVYQTKYQCIPWIR